MSEIFWPKNIKICALTFLRVTIDVRDFFGFYVYFKVYFAWSVSLSSAEADNACGEKLNDSFMASCVRNIHTKDYQNLLTGFQVTVENVGGCFRNLANKGWRGNVQLFIGNLSQNYRASPAIGDHTVLPATRHRWTRPALLPAEQAGTLFTYPGGSEGWVYLGVGYTSVYQDGLPVRRLSPIQVITTW